ncbi:MAG: D-alanyl-D-alanine carboxypeptidase [Erysipelotrichaceae bacterium]|nr:D-alanyl-D-alanine carboxypeptidase [Erysipelotrichaceae bacterium]
MKILIILTTLFSLIKNKTEETSSYLYNSYIVYDSNTNKVLEGYSYKNQRGVASISKIMTAVLAIESGMLENFVAAPNEIKKGIGSSIYMEEGEVNSIEELVYGLMLRSGNDCAITIAYAVSGNIESFVNLMNQKAKEIGMKNTIFNNPSGLDEEDEGNLSTCEDMAILTSYAMKLETFRRITSTKAYKSTHHGIWVNKNKLLNQYEYAIGGKTGYTKKARRTLVTVAKKDDTEIVVVTLDCGGDFAFHKSLYEKWFDQYKTYLLIEKGNHTISNFNIKCDEDIYASFENTENLIIIFHIMKEEKKMLIHTNRDSIILGRCKVI